MPNHALTSRLPLLAAILAAAALVGCTSSAWIGSDGIPHDRYIVGGGLFVEYTAPEPGIAYLVESETRKLLGTESLEEGETFDQSPANGGPDMFEEAVGVPMDQAKLLLYFVPQDEVGRGMDQSDTRALNLTNES